MEYKIKPTKITIDLDNGVGIKSKFLREFLKSIEDLNHKYYNELFGDDCNVIETIVKVNGVIAISERYGDREKR